MSLNEENGNALSPEPGAALIATPSATNVLAAQGLAGGGVGQPLAAPGQDVLKGGMDRSGLFHALRRRWLLASAMGLLLATSVAGLLYMLLPETNSATAQYEVSSSPLTLIDKGATTQTKDFGVFKQTQVAYIRSPFVLIAALGAESSKISKLPMFEHVDDQVTWLQEQLQVSFPSRGEILEVTMSGPYPQKDLKAVVEAVCRSYYEEVIFREEAQRRLPLQLLKKASSELADTVRDKLEKYEQLAKDAGIGNYDDFDPETKFMLSEVSQLQRRRREVTSSLSDLATVFKVQETQLKDPEFQKQMVDRQLQGDPMLAQMQQEQMMYQAQMRSLGAISKRGSSPKIRQLQQQATKVGREIAQYKEQMRQQIAGEQSNEPNPILQQITTEYQITTRMRQGEVQQIDAGLEKLKQKLLLKAENNIDLMLKLSEVEQLRDVQQGIATKIQNLQVEIGAPNRVRAIGGNATGAAIAETAQSRNRVTRYAFSGLGGLSTLALTCLGIGYMEFRSRRLNGPEQVDEGLGIRVIGTLPKLSNKAAALAQLNESIDSVRTALMHESTSKKRQLVMVTSPETSEGRTTVAGQLAASLARAGRRTLLIDGDLRRPVLHKLFDLPLEDGLCEVLRTEAEVTDVIRPTQNEGLWLMTAGYCDIDAVKALATEQVQPIFEKLRSDYDFIIIDGAPVLGLADSLLFGRHCDGAILSVLRDQTSVPKIHQSVELLRSVGVRLIGSVVNGVSSKADRRVTHLQQATPRRQQKKLEATEV